MKLKRAKKKTGFKSNFSIEKKKDIELNLNFAFFVKGRISNTLHQNSISIEELPEPQKHIYLITSKNQNSDFIIKTIQEKTNNKNIFVIGSRLKQSNILDSIENKNIICSQNSDNYTVQKYRNHSKIIIYDDYVILGSGNITTNNAKIEQYIIFNNPEFKNIILNSIDTAIQDRSFKLDISRVKVNLPAKDENIFYYKNRNFTPKNIIETIDKHETIDSIIVIGYRISKRGISYLNKFKKNVFYRFSDSIKTMTPDIYRMLSFKNLKLKNYHQKCILVKTDSNNYVISSSNNFTTDDNLDYTFIENSHYLLNEIKNN